jgi:hypothetical protein
MDSGLLDDIKYNCDVSDARFWGFFSVCGLLMRYRDLFRSEKGLKSWSELDQKEIMSWIAAKEARWPELEQAEFRDLSIGGRKYHPFDVAGINRALAAQQMIYGAGYGMFMKPTFFLAELRSMQAISGLTVYTSGRERVRDLFSAPGMAQGTTIFLRLEPLTMLLLYKFSELNARRIASLEDAFARYGFGKRQLIDDGFSKRLEQMAEAYADVLLCHEIAEAREDVPEWKDILILAEDRDVELYLRAIKDLVADTSEYGPYKRIVETRDRGALSLTVALMEGYRKILFPEIREAYAAFSEHEEWSAVERVRAAGYQRFREQRDGVVELYRSSGKDDFNGKVKELLK